jgi:hypothetical protein
MIAMDTRWSFNTMLPSRILASIPSPPCINALIRYFFDSRRWLTQPNGVTQNAVKSQRRVANAPPRPFSNLKWAGFFLLRRAVHYSLRALFWIWNGLEFFTWDERRAVEIDPSILLQTLKDSAAGCLLIANEKPSSTLVESGDPMLWGLSACTKRKIEFFEAFSVFSSTLLPAMESSQESRMYRAQDRILWAFSHFLEAGRARNGGWSTLEFR